MPEHWRLAEGYFALITPRPTIVFRREEILCPKNSKLDIACPLGLAIRAYQWRQPTTA